MQQIDDLCMVGDPLVISTVFSDHITGVRRCFFVPLLLFLLLSMLLLDLPFTANLFEELVLLKHRALMVVRLLD